MKYNGNNSYKRVIERITVYIPQIPLKKKKNWTGIVQEIKEAINKVKAQAEKPQ